MNKHKAATLNKGKSIVFKNTSEFIPLAISENSKLLKIYPKMKIPIKKPKSPIRFIINAFFAASL